MATHDESIVIDGEPEPAPGELVASIEERHAAWEALVARADGRVNEPGVAGEWSLRDVVAHINAYLRFYIENLGGPARPSADMPEDVGFDLEKRNQWMHEQDHDLPWAFVATEGNELHNELIRQVQNRSPQQLRDQFVPWHPWPIWRWLCDARDHYDEHRPSLQAWLERGSAGPS
jgi:hypothetical protein